MKIVIQWIEVVSMAKHLLEHFEVVDLLMERIII